MERFLIGLFTAASIVAIEEDARHERPTSVIDFNTRRKKLAGRKFLAALDKRALGSA